MTERTLPCPHGTALYRGFRWLHADGKPCSALNGSKYIQHANRFYKNRRKDVTATLGAGSDPLDATWVVTPEGMDTLADWLCSGDLKEQTQKMGTLIVSPIFSVVRHALGKRLTHFKSNVEHLFWKTYLQKVVDLDYPRRTGAIFSNMRRRAMENFPDAQQSADMEVSLKKIDDVIVKAAESINSGTTFGGPTSAVVHGAGTPELRKATREGLTVDHAKTAGASAHQPKVADVPSPRWEGDHGKWDNP